MERLTSEHDNLHFLCNYLEQHTVFDAKRIKATRDRLMEYEDINLTPAEISEKLARLAEFESAEKDGRLVKLPYNHMQNRITDPHGKYNAYAINGICYAGFDGSCDMAHCSGCPIRRMYIIMQDIENRAESALKEMEGKHE